MAHIKDLASILPAAKHSDPRNRVCLTDFVQALMEYSFPAGLCRSILSGASYGQTLFWLRRSAVLTIRGLVHHHAPKIKPLGSRRMCPSHQESGGYDRLMTPVSSHQNRLLPLLGCLWAVCAYSVELSQLTNQDAARGIKAALTTGASAAIGKLGVPGGFLNNPK